MEETLHAARAKLLQDQVLYLRVKVVPKSVKTEFIDVMDDDTWKIRLKAVPEKGKANEELIRYLAKLFDVTKKNVTIVSGQTDRVKLVKLLTR